MADIGCSLRTHGWHVDVALNVSSDLFQVVSYHLQVLYAVFVSVGSVIVTVTVTATVRFSQAGYHERS